MKTIATSLLVVAAAIATSPNEVVGQINSQDGGASSMLRRTKPGKSLFPEFDGVPEFGDAAQRFDNEVPTDFMNPQTRQVVGQPRQPGQAATNPYGNQVGMFSPTFNSLQQQQQQQQPQKQYPYQQQLYQGQQQPQDQQKNMLAGNYNPRYNWGQDQSGSNLGNLGTTYAFPSQQQVGQQQPQQGSAILSPQQQQMQQSLKQPPRRGQQGLTGASLPYPGPNFYQNSFNPFQGFPTRRSPGSVYGKQQQQPQQQQQQQYVYPPGSGNVAGSNIAANAGGKSIPLQARGAPMAPMPNVQRIQRNIYPGESALNLQRQQQALALAQQAQQAQQARPQQTYQTMYPNISPAEMQAQQLLQQRQQQQSQQQVQPQKYILTQPQTPVQNLQTPQAPQQYYKMVHPGYGRPMGGAGQSSQQQQPQVQVPLREMPRIDEIANWQQTRPAIDPASQIVRNNFQEPIRATQVHGVPGAHSGKHRTIQGKHATEQHPTEKAQKQQKN